MPSLLSPIAFGPISAALNSLVNSTSGSGSAGAAEEPRSAFVFTSRMRQILLAEAAERIDKFALTRNQVAIGRELNEAPLTRWETENNFAVAQTRVFDVQGQLDKAMPEIVMAVNPNSVEFDQPKRFHRQDTWRGAVFNHFTDDKGYNNDILTIRMQGNTGNIRRFGNTLEERDRGLQRLHVWQNLYQLTREPMMLTDLRPNTFTITYVSALFPVPIAFTGFFSSVLKFSENAKKPNSRDYSMEFIVQETTPDLNTIAALIYDSVVQEAANTPTSESQILAQGGD